MATARGNISGAAAEAHQDAKDLYRQVANMLDELEEMEGGRDLVDVEDRLDSALTKLNTVVSDLDSVRKMSVHL